MEDKKVEIKGKIKRFAKDYAPTIALCVVGIFIENKIYNIGRNDGYNRLANDIYNASLHDSGILLSFKEVGDVICNVTKVLKD